MQVSLLVCGEKSLIYKDDPRGAWFLWYCRYYIGQRLGEEDKRQIKRWKAMSRYVAQVVKNCQWVVFIVAGFNVRLCYIGRMTVENFKNVIIIELK